MLGRRDGPPAAVVVGASLPTTAGVVVDGTVVTPVSAVAVGAGRSWCRSLPPAGWTESDVTQRDAELLVGQHGPQVHLAGDLDQLDRLLLVLDTRQVDDDRVALAEDLGLGDAEAVDSLADALDREVEAAVSKSPTGCWVTEMPPCRSRPSEGFVAVRRAWRCSPPNATTKMPMSEYRSFCAHYLEGSSADCTVGWLDLRASTGAVIASGRRSRLATCRPCAAEPGERCGSARCRRSRAKRCRRRQRDESVHARGRHDLVADLDRRLQSSLAPHLAALGTDHQEVHRGTDEQHGTNRPSAEPPETLISSDDRQDVHVVSNFGNRGERRRRITDGEC